MHIEDKSHLRRCSHTGSMVEPREAGPAWGHWILQQVGMSMDEAAADEALFFTKALPHTAPRSAQQEQVPRCLSRRQEVAGQAVHSAWRAA